MNAIERIKALPVHRISGYEWECYECHYHFVGRACSITGEVATEDGEVDSGCQPSRHSELVERDDVLAELARP